MEDMSTETKTQEQITAAIVAQAATATAKAVLEAANAAAVVIAKENNTALTAIAVLQTEVGILKTQQTCFEVEMNHKLDNMDTKSEQILKKLDEVNQGRPTWSTALIMGALFSLCVGLITYVVTH